jgi:ParB family chromosome partitioning protein
MAPKKKAPRRRKKKPEPIGLEAAALAGEAPPDVAALAEAVRADGGSILGTYRDPLGGHWQILGGLPLAKVEPTPFQRDLSEPHVKRLANAIESLDRFLDPVIVVRTEDGRYWTPNGHHRTAAMRTLGARSIVVLVVPDIDVARRILLLNTERAHSLRERASEVIRLAEELAIVDDRPEEEFEHEFEQAPLLTLGLAYLENPRFAGSSYHSVLRRIDHFLDVPLSKALDVRHRRAAKLAELAGHVDAAVDNLRKRGFESPYLRAFVVARINPIRFKKGEAFDYDVVMDQMIRSAKNFDVAKVRQDQLARSGGPPEETS